MAGGVSRPSPVSTGLACRCPRCGRGRLFSGFLTLVERCEVCQLDLRVADSGDGPAVFVIFIVLAIAVPFAFAIWAWFDWPAWLVMVLTSILVLGGSLGLLRPAKAILVALQFRHRPQNSFHQSGGSGRGTIDHANDD